jgi:hypothetical protein
MKAATVALALQLSIPCAAEDKPHDDAATLTKLFSDGAATRPSRYGLCHIHAPDHRCRLGDAIAGLNLN